MERGDDSSLWTLFESPLEGISTLDTDMTTLHANATMKAWYESDVPLEGRKCYRTHDRTEPCSYCPVVRSFRTGEVEVEEMDDPSQARLLEVISHPVKDRETGRLTGAVKVVRDVTERQKTELALTRSREHLLRINRQLRERVKELRCLYEISRLELPLDAALERIVNLIPESFQYPHLASARIVLTDKEYQNDGFQEGKWKLVSEITVTDEVEAFVEVHYSEGDLDMEGAPFLDEESRLLDMICTLVGNRLSRSIAEQELKASKDYLSVTLRSIGDGVIVTDADGLVTEMNPQAEALTGWSLREAQGKPLSEVFQVISPSTGQPIPDVAELVIETGQIMDLANDTTLVDRQGQRYQVADSAAPISDHEGVLMGVVIVFSDVTEQYRARRALEERERQFRLLAENAQDLIYRVQVHPEMKFEYVSPSATQMFGYTPEEFYEDPMLVFRITHPEDRNKLESFLDPAHDSSAPLILRWVKEDGSTVWTEQKNVPIRDDSGRLLALEGIGRDVTKRKQAEDALREREHELAAIYDNAPLIMMVLDENRRIRKVNGYASTFTGKSSESMLGLGVGEALGCLNTRDGSGGVCGAVCGDCQITKLIDATLSTGRSSHEVEVRLSRNIVGRQQEFWVLASTVRLSVRARPTVLLCMQDVTDRKRAEERIRYLSFHDSLTGLYNRAFLEEEALRLSTNRQLPMSVIMGDLNGLKLVNDAHGHAAGDRLLIRAAKILRDSCRQEDIVARWGGDEFIILLPQTDREEAEAILARISGAMEDSQSEPIPVSIALGCAVKRTPEPDLHSVISQAEDSMYRNKLSESQSARSAVVKALMRTLGDKSHETQEHVDRMQVLARQVGESIGLNSSEMDRLDLLVLLHDIGKISISEEILNKAEPLDEDEWEIIKKHTEMGYRIASGTDEFAHVASDILSHHEHWDGSGYPDGLKRDQIPLLARIVAVVDAYDAMTNHRPFKRAMTAREALDELERLAGTQFDPRLVRILVDIVRAEEEMS